MKYYALIYHVVPDYVERRTPLRGEHLALAEEYSRRKELLLGGAFSEPADTALLVFCVEDVAVIERFVHSDPYVAHGLVERWEIRAWNVVTGSLK